MNRKYLIAIMMLLCFLLAGCSNKNNLNTNNYIASRTVQNQSITNETSEKKNNMQNEETELSSFSTKIYTPNDEARQNNITITCQALNETIVKPGETFSFCNTVRESNSRQRISKS